MQVTEFGKTDAGRVVRCVSIRAGGLAADILTLGCTLKSVHLDGTPHSLTLGSDTLADYIGQMLYFGAVVGPVANRIAGAQTTLDGQPLHFEANENGNLLHGGAAGTHSKYWEILDVTADSVTLGLTLPDGEGGFPATRQISACYQIVAPATLRLTLRATTDAATLINLANHSYWTLDGTPNWGGHSLQISADHLTATDANLLPTGAIQAVEGSAYDLRAGRRLIPGAPPLDTNFCLASAKSALRPVATLTGKSGLKMVVCTTETGLQIYDSARTARPGKPPYEGIAIEAQGWPDAPNHANFPSVKITPDHPYAQTTEWRFSKS